MTEDYIAILTLKYILESGKERDFDIATLTSRPFMQQYVPLACYWSNDMIDICLSTLNIEQPAEYPSYDSNTSDQWYAWFEATVNKQWASVVAFDQWITK